MIQLLLGLAVLMGAGASIALYAAAKAPIGYEDFDGFHYGPENSQLQPQAASHDFHGAVPVPTR